jgi:NTE family protein
VRLDRDDDLERLARILAGASTGYVCSGGGAKGFAHIGVLRALHEANVHIDYFGGSSMGAIVAASAAMDWSYDHVVAENRQAFTEGNPLGDYEPFPFVSVFRGRRIERRLQRHFGQLHIEDMWLPFYAVSANLTRGETHVHRRGLLWRALRATVAIPGALPPVVIDSELHVDGGVIDNLPIAAMRDLGADRIVASHVTQANAKLAVSELPTGIDLLREKLLRTERAKVPGLVDIVTHSTGLGRLANMAAAAADIDLYVQTPLRGVGMLDWKKFDQVISAGYHHARDLLAHRDASLRPRATAPDSVVTAG